MCLALSSLHSIWPSPLATHPSFVTLQSWADEADIFAVQDAVSTGAPACPSEPIAPQISGAAGGLEEVFTVLNKLQDRREYCATLLRCCLDRLIDELSKNHGQPLVHPSIPEWLEEAKSILSQYNSELSTLRTRMSEAERARHIPLAAANWTLRVAERQYTRQWRTHAQLEHVARLFEDPWTSATACEVQRRLSWVLCLREFSREVNWDVGSTSAPTGSLVPTQDRLSLGRELLQRYRPHISAEELALYERASRSNVRNRDLAFDLDRTLVATFDRASAMTELERQPERYDVAFDHVAHQFTRMRVPYRGMQAMLLGLWAAGNRLRLYTSSFNSPDNHEVFFNDFPLIKVAFEIVAPEHAGDVISIEQLHSSAHYMDGIKRKEFGDRHFNTNQGKKFLETLKIESGMRNLEFMKDSKIPFPDFPFDLLIDDLWYYAGEMATVGFGRRWVEAKGNASETLLEIERFFATPLDGVSPAILDWLQK